MSNFYEIRISVANTRALAGVRKEFYSDREAVRAAERLMRSGLFRKTKGKYPLFQVYTDDGTKIFEKMTAV